MENRDKDILKSLKDLDLSPTMEKNAREKYDALCNYLNDYGLESDFKPQGSFYIGTVIKPYREGMNRDYDLDVLAVLNRDKQNTDAKSVKKDVGDAIKDNGVYADKLEKEDRNCWTLKYAEVTNGIGFSLDIVPAVNEVEEIKSEIILSGVDISKVQNAVSITDKRTNYEWLTSNPIGFGDWFLEISNKNITSDMKAEQYNKMPFDIRTTYASIEKIPTYYYRSNLQRAVQFIKRHRDIYYDRSNKRNHKPSSILLSALVADSIKDKSFLSVSEIIESFVDGYKNKTISIMKNHKILNPVDLREDLVENYSHERMIILDEWIESLSNFIHIENDKKFRQTIHNDINNKVFSDSFDIPKNIFEPAKPWMVNNE